MTGYSEMTISRASKYLQKEGFIRKVRDTSNPILFTKTDKVYLINHRGCSRIRYHHAPIKFKILRYPTNPVLWDKEWECKGVKHHLLRNILIRSKQGDFIVKAIRFSKGKRSSTMTIWMPDSEIVDSFHLLDKKELDLNRSMIAARYIQKAYGFVLALPEYQQASHFALEGEGIPDIDAEGLDGWIDRSKGEPEFETTNEDVALTWLNIHSIISDLQRQVNEIKSELLENRNAWSEFMGIVRRGLDKEPAHQIVLEDQVNKGNPDDEFIGYV